MSILRKRQIKSCLSLVVTVVLTAVSFSANGAESYIPPESVVGTTHAGDSLVLLSPLEMGSSIQPGGFAMQKLSVRKADPAVGTKVGHDAIMLSGTALEKGKGDFVVSTR